MKIYTITAAEYNDDFGLYLSPANVFTTKEDAIAWLINDYNTTLEDWFYDPSDAEKYKFNVNVDDVSNGDKFTTPENMSTVVNWLYQEFEM